MGKYEKVSELLENKEFVDELSMTNSVEEIQAAFAGKEIELSEAEVNEMLVAISTLSGSGELGENELENVSGGGAIGKLWSAIKTGWNLGGKFCDWMYKTFGIV